MINSIKSYATPLYTVYQNIQTSFQKHTYTPLSESGVTGNGDNQTGGIEGITYVAMDVGNAANRGIGLAGLATLNGAFFIGLGTAYVYTGLNWVCRDSNAELNEAQNLKVNEIAQKKLFIAKLGRISSMGFVAAGVALVGLGTIILLGKTLAAGLKFALIITGAIYIGRGAIMMQRSYMKYKIIDSLHQELKNSNLTSEKILEILEKYCCFKDEKDIYTDSTREAIKENPSDFLKKLDKELYIQKCQIALGGLIGFLMIAGGGMSVAGALATGGTSTVLTYVSLGVFAVSEMAFIPYDSGYFFDKAISYLCPYNEAKERKWITNLPQSTAPLENS